MLSRIKCAGQLLSILLATNNIIIGLQYIQRGPCTHFIPSTVCIVFFAIIQDACNNHLNAVGLVSYEIPMWQVLVI